MPAKEPDSLYINYTNQVAIESFEEWLELHLFSMDQAGISSTTLEKNLLEWLECGGAEAAAGDFGTWMQIIAIVMWRWFTDHSWLAEYRLPKDGQPALLKEQGVTPSSLIFERDYFNYICFHRSMLRP